MAKKSLTAILISILTININAQTLNPVDYVNTLMGTDSEYKLSNGNTYPAIALPWGMNFWTPRYRTIASCGRITICFLIL